MRPNMIIFSRQTVVALLVGSIFVASPSGRLAGNDSATPVDPDTMEKWVTELRDDSYRRRQSAAKKLIKAGPIAVPFVTAGIESGDLETTLSSIRILHEIALEQPPEDFSGAWSELLRLAQHGTGSRRTRSATAVEEIREYRSGQAQRALREAGVFVGHDDFVVRAISQQKAIVQIDDDWNGDLNSLNWLSWLRGIEYARIKGSAIRADVLEKLTRMIDLNTIALVEGSVTPEVLEPLLQMSRIHSLEFRYVELGEEMATPIIQLPIRVSLGMKGTGIPKASVDAIRDALPGLQIDCNEGGFLGVTCQASAFNECRIASVMPGSAADKAGLIAMDVVVGIDDEAVQRFEDLQQAIGMHTPGEEVTVRFRRGSKEQAVTVQLGKLEER